MSAPYVRTTGASRRVGRKIRYRHVSKTFIVSPLGKVTFSRGRTLDYRRSEWKRLRRMPHSSARAARVAYIERCWREGKSPARPSWDEQRILAA